MRERVTAGDVSTGAMMQLKAGLRLRSVACATNVIVVKAPEGDTDLRCGGHPMVALGDDAMSLEPAEGFVTGSSMGKRYEFGDLELLCTKPGVGTIAVGDQPMDIKAAKSLPSSD